MKKHFNKFLSFFLVLAMMVSVVSPAAVSAEEQPEEEVPRIGFYAGETTESGVVEEYTYTNFGADSFYVIMQAAGEGEMYLQDMPYLSLWDHDKQMDVSGNDVADYATLSEVQGSDNVYKVTITAQDANFQLWANIDVRNTDGNGNPEGEPWTDMAGIDVRYEETGLVVTQDLNWDTNPPSLRDDSWFAKELDANMPYLTLAFKYIAILQDGAKEETPINAKDFNLNIFDENGNETPDASIDENSHDGNLVDVKITRAGTYKIGYEYESEQWDYVTLHIGQPRVGFYTAADYEKGSYIFETLPYYDRDEKPQFYVIVKKAEEGLVQNIPVNFLQVRDHETETEITDPEQVADYISYVAVEVPAEKTAEIQAVYKVTVVTDRGFQLQANVECDPDDPEQEAWTDSPQIGIWYEERPDGLKVADYIVSDEEGNPCIHDESGYFGELMIPFGEEREFAFVVRDEEGENTVLNGTMFVQFNEEEEIELGDEVEPNDTISIGKIHTSTDNKEWYYYIRLEKCGTYIFTYKEDGKEDKSVTLYAEPPLFGIYTSATTFDDTTIYLEPELDYLNQDYYVVVSKKYGEWVEGFEPDVLNYEKDVVEFVQESSGEEYDVYRLQVHDDVTAGFDMILPVTVRWGEGDDICSRTDERWYHLKGDESGRVIYTDGEEHLGFAGYYLQDYEYEAGGTNWASGEPMYYVHADSAQGVIDKLSAVADGEEVLYKLTDDVPDINQSTAEMDITNTGYVMIHVSHLGDVELEDQYVSDLGDMKGIKFESGHDWRFTKHERKNGFYVEDIVYKVQPALETIRSDSYKEDVGEVKIPERFEGMNYISEYMGNFYEVDDEGDAFVMGDEIEIRSDEERAFLIAFHNIVVENPEFHRAAMTNAFEFPNLHVNLYCDMTFGGAYEKIFIGLKKGKDYTATIINNGMTGKKTIYTMKDLGGQQVKVINVSNEYGDMLGNEIKDTFDVQLYSLDPVSKANFDMSKVKWNYTDAYTYDGKAKKVELTGLPAGLNVTYTGNTATEVGTYTAKATFSYDDSAYNAPDVSKIATLTWQIKEPSKVGQTVASTSAKYEVTADEDGNKTVEYTGLTKKSTKKVKIPSSVKIGNETYKVTSIADDAFKNNKKMTSVTIPSTVETIGKNAFKGCKKLTKVTIPKNVTTIGKDAFRNCKKLKTITIKSKNITSVGKGAFKGVSSKITIKVPKSKKKAYTKLFKKAGYKNKIK